MSGKAYTMREMRGIVEYLTQHKAYKEIKGRKMWMNFANSQSTNRTWQSLKETFLKRILPDIHNPYFQLTMEQIQSFRQGIGVEENAKNKLEVHTISDDSSNNAETEIEKDNAQPSTSKNDNEENTSGENRNTSPISSQTRSSTDTYIVEKCYQTAEEIQRDLESPQINNAAPSKVTAAMKTSTTKTLRDFITYSEPLTPMLQELLDDFASEDESDRPMRIVEEVTPVTDSQSLIDKSTNAPSNADNSETATTIENAKCPSPEKSAAVDESPKEMEDSEQLCTVIVENTENVTDENIASADTSKEMTKDIEEENVISNKPQEEESQAVVINDSEDLIAVVSVIDSSPTKEVEKFVSKPNDNATQNCSHTTNDSVLPNNPEGFDKTPIENKQLTTKTSIEDKQNLKQNGDITENLPDTKKDENIAPKKRSHSKDEDDATIKKKKQGNNSDNPTEKSHSVIDISNDETENSILIQSDIEETDKLNPAESHIDEPKTTNQNKEVEDHDPKNDKDEEIKNPCLKSVSLYAEQFNTTKYNETDSSDVEAVNTKTPIEEKKQVESKSDGPKEVILKSVSDCETDHIGSPVKEPKSTTCVSTKVKKDKALANIFGFSTGGVTNCRKRHSSYKKSRSHHYDGNTNSFNSSEWTSESDSDEYVSPPRGRKNRHSRKYLKPQSSRILSLEEEGGLFVTNGKKIFPLIKDGKIVKNYLTYLPGSDKEDESYWKLKYVEERKKTEELKRMLEQFNKEQDAIRESKSPILQQSTSRIPASNLNRQSVLNETTVTSDRPVVVPEPKVELKAPEVEHKQENVKLKFTINNEEVQLEGQWSNINPVLDKVMQIFNINNNKETTQVNNLKPVPNSSGTSTPIVISPVDPEIREKVDKIEDEIFKEIEERDKEETNKTELIKPVNGQESYVTRRRGRPLKETVSPGVLPASTPKKSVTPKVTEVKEPIRSTRKRRSTESEDIVTTEAPKKQTPIKIVDEPQNKKSRSLRTRKSNVVETVTSDIGIDQENDVRYKLPPNRNTRLSASRLNEKKSKSKENAMTFLSPDSLSKNSIESTQGYQDSDMSPYLDIKFRRKKKFSLSLQYRSNQPFHRFNRRRSTSCLPRLNISSDSNNSTFSAPVQKVTNENSSLNTEVYRSESYQLLLPQPKICVKRLEMIDEASPLFNIKDQINKQLFTSARKGINENVNKMNNDTMESNQGSIEPGSSSNVSLPLSPELSIVENLSVSKDMLSNVENPTINETESNYIPELDSYQKYLISNVDVSVPLMEQECGYEESNVEIELNNNLTNPKGTGISDSLLNKIGTVKIRDNSALLHSLDQRLQDLLLESGKKISPESISKPMEVDVSNVKDTVKANGKKRCSTPRKKNVTKKNKPSKINPINPVIEEEHMELCSRTGRRSCPPYIDACPIEETAINFDDTFFESMISQKAPDKVTKKNKKDIIKVKILRPNKKCLKESQEKKMQPEVDQTKLSVNVNSRINDTGLGVSFTMLNDSVDLIHNHSETCLQAHECVGNSVEFIENSSKSIISIDSNSMLPGDDLWQNVLKEYSCKNGENTPPEIFGNYPDKTGFEKEFGLDSQDTPCETAYHSPVATDNTSLITEDLSDELPSRNSQPEEPSLKWYLLSDDETNTMGEFSELPNNNYTSSSGANLNQLFPIACAVPDLSTITEMSRENDDNSRRPTTKKDDDTMNDFDSMSIFS